jgi:hypothetical protein
MIILGELKSGHPDFARRIPILSGEGGLRFMVSPNQFVLWAASGRTELYIQIASVIQYVTEAILLVVEKAVEKNYYN